MLVSMWASLQALAMSSSQPVQPASAEVMKVCQPVLLASELVWARRRPVLQLARMELPVSGPLQAASVSRNYR
jgi:hypothetical protein